MGTGWKRAFCTAIPKDRESPTTAGAGAVNCHSPPNPSPRSCVRLGFFSGGSNPSTPRLNQPHLVNTPTLRCRTSAAAIQQALAGDNNNNNQVTSKSSAKPLAGSNPASPRSPFSILKNSLRFSRNNCGVCMQSVKSGQGMAIYTAECSHAFHFPCIAAHVGNNGSLICPVCKSTWKDVPLLAIHKVQPNPDHESDKKIQTNENPKTRIEQQPQQQQIHYAKKQYHNSHSHSRGYDDDEPLSSPTATARFVPIPEVDDEEEEDVEEFKGFFVNPISSSSDEAFIGGRDNRNVEVSLMPEAAVVSTGRTREAHVIVLRIKAPPPPPPSSAHIGGSANLLDRSRRAPIDLVAVLDVSGSMTGSKLQMMKRAIRLVISSLGSSDRLSIVAFSASPKRLLPLRRMTANGQRAARRIIDRLGCSQGSSVGEALKKAAKILEDRRERNPVASIMLLSDGHDDDSGHSNDQDQRKTGSHVSSTRFSHVEIPVHESGFGAKQKKPGYVNEPAEDKFAKCVGGLLSVVVHDLKLQLSIGSGSDPAEIAAVYSSEGKPMFIGSSSIKIGDLYAEEERELLVELRVPTPAVGSHHVLSVRCNYRDPATKELINGRDHALLVPRSQVVGAYNTPIKIERLRNLFITTRAIAESRRLIENNNDLNSAHHLLSSAQALIVRSSSVSADEYISGLDAELAGLRLRRDQIERRRNNNGGEKEVTLMDEYGEPLTPTTAWRAAERLAKVAMMKKSLNRKVSDLHGFENARF
ncbi:E3 ubiquitin-protein ligase WAV3-like [Impatiens glandulifera]|uniref:E3 ubiquitin-protein ligase WAV3-like n=1 Tax=Impatiens glandulifera TaxID=253017 RepID=UPI001FB0677E|nr:E3 ubiquitin-protein ligase WAV3-like [Impatiens glandulifera]